MRICWDFRHNQPRHFPEGTYRQQTATELGRIELDRMSLIGRVWRAYVGTNMEKWDADGDEISIHKWLNERPPPSWAVVDRIVEEAWH